MPSSATTNADRERRAAKSWASVSQTASKRSPFLADDLSTVIEEILKLPEVDTDRVGLYGVSQASWYMPLVMANEPELDFAVYQSAGAIPIGIHMIFEALSIHQGLPFDEATRQFEEIAEDYDGPLGFDQRPLLEASPHALSHGRKGPERPVPRESGRDPASCKSGRGCHVLSRRPARWRARASWKTSGRWPSGSRSDRAHSKGLYHPVLFLLPVNRFQA